MENHKDKIPTKEIGELLEVVSEKLPKLVSELMKTMFSETAGEQMGKSVGKMYKELIDAGIPQDDALSMVKDYMNTLKNVTSNFKHE